MNATPDDRDLLRILRRLSVKDARLVKGPTDRWHFEGRSAKDRTDQDAVAMLQARALVEPEPRGGLVIASTGSAWLRRALAGGDFAAQHQEREAGTITDETGSRSVVVNHDESPLAWLRRRKDRDGRPMVDATEFAAGERLRADYSRGQIMPRVTANWSAAVAGRGRSGNDAADITEIAMGARRRVEQALQAVGPELGGLLVDFCCFLKGLEEIERARRWPPRSAKVALRLGLASLARHYGMGLEARGRYRAGATLHWGAEDYRPALD